MKQEYLVVARDQHSDMWVAGRKIGEGVEWFELLDSIPVKDVQTLVIRDELEKNSWRFESPHEFHSTSEAVEMYPGQAYEPQNSSETRKEELALVVPEVASVIRWGDSPEFNFKPSLDKQVEAPVKTRRVPPKVISTPKAYVPPKEEVKVEQVKPQPKLKPVEGAEAIDWSTDNAKRNLSLGENEDSFFQPFVQYQDDIDFPEDIADASQVYLPGERRDTRTRYQKKASITVNRPKKITLKALLIIAGVIAAIVVGGRVTSALTATTYVEVCVDSRTHFYRSSTDCLEGKQYSRSAWVPEDSVGNLKEGESLPENSTLDSPSGNVVLKTFDQQQKN